MNIALVSPYDYAHPGGANTHVALLTREFLRRGHRVKIVAPSSKSVESLGVDNFVRLGMPIPIPANGSLARVSFSVWLSPKIKALLRAEQFDVIHLHEPLTSLLSLAVLHHSRSLNIGTFHSFWQGTKRFQGFKRLVRPYFDRLHGRIAVSPPAGQFIGKLFPAQYEVIPNPVDRRPLRPPGPTPPTVRRRQDQHPLRRADGEAQGLQVSPGGLQPPQVGLPEHPAAGGDLPDAGQGVLRHHRRAQPPGRGLLPGLLRRAAAVPPGGPRLLCAQRRQRELRHGADGGHGRGPARRRDEQRGLRLRGR